MKQILVPIALFAMITIISVGRPLVRAWARRIESQPTPNPLGDDAAARLERMEHAIEAMALEVERISEGQRFTTKLLAERADRLPLREPALVAADAALRANANGRAGA